MIRARTQEWGVSAVLTTLFTAKVQNFAITTRAPSNTIENVQNRDLPPPLELSQSQRKEMTYTVSAKVLAARKAAGIARTRPQIERFINFVEPCPTTGCWLWTGSLSKGYGSFDFQRAHRVSYKLFVGTIPSGQFICHHCDVPSCVNPAHLFVGTAKTNSDDMRSKRRRVILYGEECGSAKLTVERAAEIRRLRYWEGLSLGQIAARFGVSAATVSRIAREQTWAQAIKKDAA